MKTGAPPTRQPDPKTDIRPTPAPATKAGNGEQVQWDVEGMTCTNCALTVEKYFHKRGLSDASVDFSNAEVRFTPASDVDLDAVKTGVRQLGYAVKAEAQPAEGSTQPETSASTWQLGQPDVLFLIAAVFSLPLLLAMFLPDTPLRNPWLQLGLALPPMAVGVWHFGRSAFTALRHGSTNMDVLIIMGSSAAFGYSLYGTLAGKGEDFLFYETAGMIISLVLLGNLIERRAIRGTTTAVKELLALQHVPARVIDEDTGNIRELDARQAAPGMRLQVNLGDRVPVDGVLEAGQAWVDEKLLTGESLPVEKTAGAEVIGGSLVTDGQFRLRATAVGKASALGQIIGMVKQAQSDRPETQRLADRISAIFVPTVVGLALLTLGLSVLVAGLPFKLALIHAVAVLVISCPCAMGLATPTAVSVGLGRAARRGILVKGASTLEALQKIRTVVFDKTGTLTTGKLSLQTLHVLDDNWSAEQVKAIIRGLESRASHPVAQALYAAFPEVEPVDFQNVHETEGKGLSGTAADGTSYRIGSFRLAGLVAEDARHDVYLLAGEQLIATVDLTDELRPDAKQAVDVLHARGYRTAILSGDREAKTRQVAQQLGIEAVYAQHLPDQKLARLDELRQSGPVAMVGDGINDAPALTRADLGISLGSASQIASDAAQVILLSSNLSAMEDLLHIGNATVRTIKQNLFWAFFYNVLAIPAAALGYLNPMIAAAAMAGSDIVVIGNSLRLKFRKLATGS